MRRGEAGGATDTVPPPPMAWNEPEAMVSETRVTRLGVVSCLRNLTPIAALWGLLWHICDLAVAGSLGLFTYADPYFSPEAFPLGIAHPSLYGMAWAVGIPVGCVVVVTLLLALAVRFTGGMKLRFREPMVWRDGRRELLAVTPVSALVLALSLWFVCLVMPVGVVLFVEWATGGSFLYADWEEYVAPVGVGLWFALMAPAWAFLYGKLTPLWGGIEFECRGGSVATSGQQVGEVDRIALRSIWFLQPALVCMVLGGLIVLIPLVMEPEYFDEWEAWLELGGIAVFTSAGGFVAGTLLAGIYWLIGWVTGGLRVDVR